MEHAEELYSQAVDFYYGRNGRQRDGAKALELFAQAQKEGKDSVNYMGLIYLYGVAPIERDYKKAADYFAMNPDNKYCLYNLGCAYMNGWGVEKDPAKAAACFRKGALKNHGGCCDELGLAYSKGNGVEQDDQQAVCWFEKSLANKSTSGLYDYGYYLGFSAPEERRDEKRAIELFSQLKENNNKKKTALRLTGVLYMDGQGNVQADGQLAFQFFQKAAEMGDNIALRLMGDCYRDGTGTNKDFDKAREWYQKAKDAGVKNVEEHEKELETAELYQQAMDYAHGTNGCSQDGEKALALFEQLQKSGTDCTNEIAHIYRHGIPPISKDVQKALVYYEMNPENTACLYNLGIMYKYGDGVEKNAEKAAAYFRRGAELNDGNCCMLLGIAYYYGKGVEQDYKTGINWIEKAVAAHADNAVFNLAYLIGFSPREIRDEKRAINLFRRIKEDDRLGAKAYGLTGLLYKDSTDNTVKDEDQAFIAFTKAVQKGDKDSLLYLGDCYRDGTGTEPDFDLAEEYYKKAEDAGLAEIASHTEELKKIKEKASVVYCPCCGKPLKKEDSRLYCPLCKVEKQASDFTDLKFIRHYNLANAYRQSGMYYDAMYHSRLLTEQFGDHAESWWTDFLAQYGIQFLKGDYFYHIDRMTMDFVLFHPSFIKTMEIATGSQKKQYYTFARELMETVSRRQEDVKKYKVVEPAVFCFHPEDQKAAGYVERLQKEFDTLGIGRLTDLNKMNYTDGFDVSEAVFKYIGVRYAHTMILVCSDEKYLDGIENDFMRFGEYAKWDANKHLFAIAVGSFDEIYHTVFASPKLTWTDQTPLDEVVRTIIMTTGRYHNEYSHLTDMSLLWNINKIRQAYGEEPLHGTGSFFSDINVEYKPDEHLIIKVQFRNRIQKDETLHLSYQVTEIGTERIAFQDDFDLLFHAGNDICKSTINLKKPQNEVRMTPGLYCVSYEKDDSKAIYVFKVEESGKKQCFRRLADQMDLLVPEDRWNDVIEERQIARMAEAERQYQFRIKAAQPKFTLAVKTVQKRKLIKKYQEYTIWLKKEDGSCYRAKTNDLEIIEPFKPAVWNEEAEQYRVKQLMEDHFDPADGFVETRENKGFYMYSINAVGAIIYRGDFKTSMFYNDLFTYLDTRGKVRFMTGNQSEYNANWLKRKFGNSRQVYKSIFYVNETLYGICFDDTTACILGSSNGDSDVDRLHLEELMKPFAEDTFL